MFIYLECLLYWQCIPRVNAYLLTKFILVIMQFYKNCLSAYNAFLFIMYYYSKCLSINSVYLIDKVIL